MVSILRLLVLGLVVVVPKLAWRPWPRLNGIMPPGDEGVMGDAGEAEEFDVEEFLMAASSPDWRPTGEMGVPYCSMGVSAFD